MAENQLIQEYAGQPVILVEYNVYNMAPLRDDRFQAAWNVAHTGYPAVPRDMVDSGNQFLSGSGPTSDYYTDFKNMIQTSLARPAYATMTAVTRRVTDTVEFRVSVTNQSTITLASAANAAMVHGIFYEENRVLLTDHYGRGAGYKRIDPPLAPNQTQTYTVKAWPLFTDTSTFGWDKMRAFALVDYRPAGGASGAFDMLQATQAPSPLAATPSDLSLLVSSSGPDPAPVPVTLQGAAYASWAANADVPWLAVTPSGGTAAETPSITLQRNQLPQGWQAGTVYFSALDSQGKAWSSWVTVKALNGSITRTYVPCAYRAQ